MREPPASQNKVDAKGVTTTGDKTTCPLQWTGHGALRPCVNFWWCGVHVLDGTETHEDMFEENAHTEARDARCLHASEHKQSIFSTDDGLGQRGQDPKQ